MHKTVYLPKPCYGDDPLLQKLQIRPGKLWFPFTAVNTSQVRDQHDLSVSISVGGGMLSSLERRLSLEEISELEAALGSLPEAKTAFCDFLKRRRARQRCLKVDEDMYSFLLNNPEARKVLVARQAVFYLANHFKGKGACWVGVYTSSPIPQVLQATNAFSGYLAADRDGVVYDCDEKCASYSRNKPTQSQATRPLDFLLESTRDLEWSSVRFEK